MASTKVVTVLVDNVAVVVGTPNTSSTWDLVDGYGGQLHIKITNGATGPTIAAQSQIWASPDSSNWYMFGGALVSTLGNAIVTSWSIPIPIGVKFLNVITGSNTGQNVTLRISGSEVTAIS